MNYKLCSVVEKLYYLIVYIFVRIVTYKYLSKSVLQKKVWNYKSLSKR